MTWVGAFAGSRLVGFVHAVWDAGVHASLPDTAVDPNHQRRGVESRLMHRLVADVRRKPQAV